MVLLMLGASFFAGFSFYPRTVKASVCNELKGAVLEDVRVRLIASQMNGPSVRLGSLGPGNCGTVELASLKGEAGVVVGYGLGVTSHESEPAYAEPGYHCHFAIQSAGAVAIETEVPGMFSHPPYLLFQAALLCTLLAALSFLLGCRLLVVRYLGRRAPRTR